MGTCNFWTMDDFDLVVMSDEMLCKNYLGDEFIAERMEEIEDYDPIGDIELAWDLFNEDMNEWSGMDEVNDTLLWYNIRLKSGYYDGVQFYIDTEWLPIEGWDDEECEYYFDRNKEETKKMIEEEKERINKFLDEMVTLFGFERIRCVGVFSNGEAVYEKAE